MFKRDVCLRRDLGSVFNVFVSSQTEQRWLCPAEGRSVAAFSGISASWWLVRHGVHARRASGAWMCQQCVLREIWVFELVLAVCLACSGIVADLYHQQLSCSCCYVSFAPSGYVPEICRCQTHFVAY
ncbi:hypothetical protein Taro_010860 [Colocasia esculenta]|uniref:Uncharacterized protein n=1 Tax=Colocasia esculenta TaxID=4460 RepID=A0A843U894_COLES|nr:hypothetical protein [Colocasia esculenta]